MADGNYSAGQAIGYALGGGYAADREDRRKAVQLQAAQLGMQFDQQGNLGYIPGSKEDLQAQQIQALTGQLQEVESRFIRKDTWDAVEAGIKDGNYSQFNNFLSSNQKVRDMYSSKGIQSIESFDPYNDEHLTAYANAGFNTDVIDYLKQARDGKVEGMTPEDIRNVASSFSVAYPLYRTTENDYGVTSLNDFAATTNLLREASSNEKQKVLLDAIANGQNALTGITTKAYEASTMAKQLANQTTSISNQTSQLKLDDMLSYLEKNPGASLADYAADAKRRAEGNTDTAEMKNIKYMAEQLGVSPAEVLQQKQQQKSYSSLPSEIKVSQYNQGKTRTILDKAGAQNIADVDITKLDQENYDQLAEFAKKDQKNIDEKALRELMAIQSAAGKLNPNDLAKTTGIADASFNAVLDTLGIDLPDEELVQSSNYNLIKNSITRLNAGTAVTGSEMDRMVKQIGNEFKSDRTVQIKTAETLENMADQYEAYSKTAPAFYAVHLRTNVQNLKTAANKLRGKDTKELGKGSGNIQKPTSKPKYKEGDTEVWNGKTFKLINNQWIEQGAK